MLISVCIPMYNESLICGFCSSALEKLRTRVETELGCETEIVFCDDGSHDNTQTALKKHIEENGLTYQKVVGYSDNRGKGGALKEAVKNTAGDVVVYTDADLAYGTDFVFDAIAQVVGGADMVVGSRRLDKEGYGEYTLMRKIASKIYISLLHVVAGFKLSDSQCGLKAIKGDEARKIFSSLTTNGFSFDLEVIMRAQKAGLKIKEIPVRIVNHRESTSKVHIVRDSFKMLRDVLRIKKTLKNLPN